MQIFLHVIFALTTTFWIGAMFGFGTLVAPAIFRGVPSREQAGQISGQILARIDSLGLVSSGILLVVTIMQAFQDGWGTLPVLRVLLVAGMLGLTVWSATTVRAKVESLKEQMGRPIEEVPATDPLRVEHGKYHRLARSIFFLVLVLGLILIGISAV